MADVVLCIPTISQFALLHNAVQSAMRGTRPPDRVMIIDNSGGMFFDEWVNDYDKLTVFVPQRNIGVAGSWNYFIAANPDSIVVLSNDDVTFHDSTLAALVDTVENNPRAGLFLPNAPREDQFSLFTIRHSVWSALGPFDPIFYPGYFEDDDYVYRCKLAHVQIEECFDVRFDHVRSATLRGMNQQETTAHHARFESNLVRYIEKWGGKPGEERFNTPYNLQEGDENYPYYPNMFPSSVTTA